MTDHLTIAEVLAIHEDQIARYGGAQGVRDMGLLEAALFRPQTGYYAGLIEEATALWESLSRKQPFVDGNKRAAFGATYTLLAINGGRFTVEASQAMGVVVGLDETHTFEFSRLAAWLRTATHVQLSV